MAVLFIAICGLAILWGIEIRHKEIHEQLNILKDQTNRLETAVLKLTEESKKKIRYE